MKVSNTKALADIKKDVDTKVSVAIDRTAERLVDKLVDIIYEKVYSYQENWGGRTYEFGNNWYNSAVSNLTTVIEPMVQSLPQAIGYEDISHIIPMNELIEVIESGIGYDLDTRVNARPFWDTFIFYCNTNLIKIFNEEMKKVGLTGYY